MPRMWTLVQKWLFSTLICMMRLDSLEMTSFRFFEDFLLKTVWFVCEELHDD